MLQKGKLRLRKARDLFQIAYQLVAKLGRGTTLGLGEGPEGVGSENQPGVHPGSTIYYLPVAVGKHSDI